MARIPFRRHGKDYLGALRTLRRDWYADLGKSDNGIEADLGLLSAKANQFQTASSWCSIYPTGNPNLVRLSEILIYNFGFSGAVYVAWGRDISVLYGAAVVCRVTCIPKQEG